MWLMGLLSVVVSAGVILPTGGSLFAAKKDSDLVSVQINKVSLNFIVNGELYQTPKDQEGFLYNNNTYVPLRFAAYTFGQAVSWNADNYSVTIGNPSQGEQEMINKYNHQNHRELTTSLPAGSKGSAVKLNVSMKPVKYVFSDKVKIPSSDRPGVLYKGTLYVPFRFFLGVIRD